MEVLENQWISYNEAGRQQQADQNWSESVLVMEYDCFVLGRSGIC
jgi:hypothetical protein